LTAGAGQAIVSMPAYNMSRAWPVRTEGWKLPAIHRSEQNRENHWIGPFSPEDGLLRQLLKLLCHFGTFLFF